MGRQELFLGNNKFQARNTMVMTDLNYSLEATENYQLLCLREMNPDELLNSVKNYLLRGQSVPLGTCIITAVLFLD